MLFFGLVYVVEGIGQTGGLIAQPLNYYLKQIFGWTPVQVSAYLTILNLPWIIKPVYGIVSDFLPLFGYRRKAYLVLANAAAAVAFGWVTQITQPSQLIFVLLLTAYAMAISIGSRGSLRCSGWSTPHPISRTIRKSSMAARISLSKFLARRAGTLARRSA